MAEIGSWPAFTKVGLRAVIDAVPSLSRQWRYRRGVQEARAASVGALIVAEARSQAFSLLDQAMHHRSCRFVRYVQNPMKMIRRNRPVSTFGQIHGLEPFVGGHVA